MPQDDDEQKRGEGSNDADTTREDPTPYKTRPWLKVPVPIKQLFDLFPLQTLSPNKLPERSWDRLQDHNLFIHISTRRAAAGLPSPNPGCLKWQSYLLFQGVRFQIRPSCNDASPTGALPFLCPKQTSSEPPPSPIPANHIVRWIKDLKKQEQGYVDGSERELQQNDSFLGNEIKDSPSTDNAHDTKIRQEAYMSLIDFPIRNAYLHSLYMCSENFDAVAFPLYIRPLTSNFLVRTALSRQLRSFASSEFFRQYDICDPESLYRESDVAFLALSTLLGENQYFSSAAQPSLFDASVFAYTNILLDESLPWKDLRLVHALDHCDNLVAHRQRILDAYYNADTFKGQRVPHF